MPKYLKIIRLEVNLDNTNIMFKEWGRFYTDRGKNEDAWHQFLRHDKHVQGVSKLG